MFFRIKPHVFQNEKHEKCKNIIKISAVYLYNKSDKFINHDKPAALSPRPATKCI